LRQVRAKLLLLLVNKVRRVCLGKARMFRNNGARAAGNSSRWRHLCRRRRFSSSRKSENAHMLTERKITGMNEQSFFELFSVELGLSRL
jgi:hypothetical protein